MPLENGQDAELPISNTASATQTSAGSTVQGTPEATAISEPSQGEVSNEDNSENGAEKHSGMQVIFPISSSLAIVAYLGYL